MSPDNPSFPVTFQEASGAIKAMKADPRPLRRPVVVLSGIADPVFAKWYLTQTIEQSTTDQPVVGVSFLIEFTFDACRAKVIARVDEALPNDDPVWTTEVDVVAYSMGGLVARYAAASMTDWEREEGEAAPEDVPTRRRRLRIARLFTIATPHQGAILAALPTLDAKQKAMRLGSPFLAQLQARADQTRYEIIPYVRVPDRIVGAGNASPPDLTPWWVSAPLLDPGHLRAHMDPRIVADILRRLRGEPPFTQGSPRPLPD